MTNQKLSPKWPLEETKSVDPLEITKVVEPPPIDDVLSKAKQALELEVKEREHRCRECHSEHCPHYQREYTDTLEQFDSNDPKYYDVDGKGNNG